MLCTIGYNNIALLSVIVYFCFEIVSSWDRFETCSKPIHIWLLVTCIFALVTRLLGLLISYMSPGISAVPGGLGELVLELSHKGQAPAALVAFTWIVVVPLLTIGNVVGTVWLWDITQESSQCVPIEFLCFSALRLALGYHWLIVYILLAVKSFVLQQTMRQEEVHLRQIEGDADVARRWGQSTRTAGRASLASGACHGKGLSPAEIKGLPCGPCETMATGGECSICMEDFQPGENLRGLPGCGHSFHRSCIDLWLVRSADCPLCKTVVTATYDTKSKFV